MSQLDLFAGLEDTKAETVGMWVNEDLRAERFPPRGSFRTEPWWDEPDRVQMIVGGLRCMVLRHPSHLNLNGYVGITPDHPWHKKQAYAHEVGAPCRVADEPCGHWEHTIDGVIDVHGGITYSGKGWGSEKDPLSALAWMQPGQPPATDLWWFGFDTGHAGDLLPGFADPRFDVLRDGDVYRDIFYVANQVGSMAVQVLAWGQS